MSSKYLKSSENLISFGKLFGISMFSLNSHGPDYLQGLCCLPFLATYIYVAVLAFRDLSAYLDDETTTSEIPTTTIYVLIMQHIATLFFKVIYFYIRREPFKKVFFKIQKLNDFLKLPEIDYTMQTLEIVAALCLAIILNAYVELYTPTTIPIILMHQMISFTNYIEIAFMNKLLNELARQCRSINDHLQKKISFLALDKIQPKGKIWSELLDIKKLRENEKEQFFETAYEMAEAHLAIGQVAREINTVFGISILFGVLNDFTMLTYTTVTFCQDIRKLVTIGHVNFEIMLKAFNNALHDALILIKQCYSIYYWSKLKKTLKATITCLHKMWNTLAKHNEIDEKSNYLQLLIVQLFNGMPNFSTFGIITIDWPLIIFVISSVATYVVIMMQFELATTASPK